MPKRRRIRRDGEATVWVVKLKGKAYLAIRWIDPETGQVCQRSSECTKRRDAEREAAKLWQQLVDGIIDREVGWEHFRDRYEREKMAGHPIGTRKAWATVANRYEAAVDPLSIQQAADPRRVSRFIGKLRGEGLREATISGYVAYLHAAFSWAADMKLIKVVPRIPRSERSQNAGFMRGRPLTPAEFHRMLRRARAVRPADWRLWTRLLRGLWLSGLRLEESLALSWNISDAFAVDLSGKHPAFRIRAEAQKSGRDEVLPMTPDFARWLLQTPEAERTGPVFPIPGEAGQMTLKRAGRYISAMGKAAGIVVNADQGKHASAHDLRRSFGTRWAKRVMPVVLKQLMRHTSIDTTMRYYVGIAADEVADDLWRMDRAATPEQSAGKGEAAA